MAAELRRAQLLGTAARSAHAELAAQRREDEAAVALLLQTEEDNMKRLRQQGEAVIRRLLSVSGSERGSA